MKQLILLLLITMTCINNYGQTGDKFILKGDSLLNAENYSAALIEYKKSIKYKIIDSTLNSEYKTYGLIYLQIGKCYYATSKLDMAKKYFYKYIYKYDNFLLRDEMIINRMLAYAFISDCYFKTNNLDSANINVNSGIEFSKRKYVVDLTKYYRESMYLGLTGELYLTRAIIRTKFNDIKGAITDATISIDYFPSPRAYFIRGLSQILNNDNEKGCSDLQKAANEGYIEAYKMLGEFCQ